MWLDAKLQYSITRHCPQQHIVPWQVDIKAAVNEQAQQTGPHHYVVGRILADEIPRFEIGEWGDDPWEAADADSGGLEGAYASLMDKNGDFREGEFNCVNDPVVYIYRFRLHDDFACCKMPALDAFCRLFPNEALILAQYRSMWLTNAEFKRLAFEKLLPEGSEAIQEFEAADIDELQFMIRDNTVATDLKVSDYPASPPWAKPEHEAWLESNGPWKDII